MKKNALLPITILMALFSVLSMGYAFLCSSRAVSAIENATGAFYEQNPKAAAQFMQILLSRQSGDGIAAAEKLGLTGRAFRFYYHALYSDRFIWLGIGILILIVLSAAVGVFLVNRGKRTDAFDLKKRVNAVIEENSRFEARTEREAEYARLAEELRRTRELSDERSEEMRIFVENVAHEIKTPAAGMILTLDLIDESGADANRLNRLRECAAAIQNYVSLLLKLSRMRSGKIHFVREPVDLVELVNEVAREQPSLAISIDVDSAVILGDHDRLYEAIANLVRNAVKHSGESRACLILQKSGNDYRIRIRDHGDHAVQKHERYTVEKEDGSSSGIGLSLAEETAVRHFGRLSLSSHEDGGMDADILLPILPLKNLPV